MVEIKTAGWDVQHNEFLEKLGRAAMGDGPWPSNIVNAIMAGHARRTDIAGLSNRTAFALARTSEICPTLSPSSHLTKYRHDSRSRP
jgi:hypothetical protein